MHKSILCVIAALLVALTVAGCSSASTSSAQGASSDSGDASTAVASSSTGEAASSNAASASSADSSAASDASQSGQSSAALQEEAPSSESTPDYRVETDRGLFDVTVTLASSYAEGITQEELDATVAEKGFKSATLNDDGSVTYVMTRDQHAQLMEETRASIERSLSEIPNSEDYPNVTAVEHSDDFTSFSVTTTSSELTFKETLMTLSLYIFGGMYSNFNGTPVDNIHVDFINADTGEVIQSADSRNLGKSSEAPSE